jgi:hypothetical protein
MAKSSKPLEYQALLYLGKRRHLRIYQGAPGRWDLEKEDSFAQGHRSNSSKCPMFTTKSDIAQAISDSSENDMDAEI